MEYGDFECPVCGEYYQPLKQVASKFSQQIYFQFRNLPLTSIHPNAFAGARAAEAAGLHAVSLGLSALAGDDDHGLLQRGFIVYDALFAWLRFAAEERHNWPAKAA